MSKVTAKDILKQLQYGTTMSDNTEPMLTNNRNIALALHKSNIGDSKNG